MAGHTNLGTAGEMGLTVSREGAIESQVSPRPFVPYSAPVPHNPLCVSMYGTRSVSETLLPRDPNLHTLFWKALSETLQQECRAAWTCPWEHVNLLSSPVEASCIYIFKYIVVLCMTGCRRGPSLTTLSISAPNPLFSKYSGFILFVTSGPHENGYPETENIAQLVACLPDRHKGLGSFLSTPCLHNLVWWYTPVISELRSSDKRIMSSGPSSIT